MQMGCFIISLLCFFLEQHVFFILYHEIWAAKNSEIFVEISIFQMSLESHQYLFRSVRSSCHKLMFLCRLEPRTDSV